MHAYGRLLDFLFCVTALGAVYLRWPADPQPYLWLDEAWRAYGAVAEHDGQMLQLSELLLGRLGVWLFGYEAVAMRVWPLLFSVAALTGSYAFLRRLGFAGAGLCAALLIACGPGFVFHAREFKPYALDLALTTWTLWSALRYTQRPDRVRLAQLAAMLVLFAASSVVFTFVYPAIALYTFVSVEPAERRALRPLLLAPLVFLAVYALYLRPQVTDGNTMRYWAAYYFSSPAEFAAVAGGARSDIGWFLATGWQVAVAAYFVLLPILALFAKDRVALALFAPFPIQLGFAAAKLYPLFGRPSYYLYGLMAIAVPYAIARVLRRGDTDGSLRRQIVDAVLIASVLVALALNGTLQTKIAEARNWPIEQGRDAFSLLADQHRDGDVVFVNYAAYYTYKYHSLDPTSPASQVEIDTASWGASLRDNAMGQLCRGIKRQAGSRAKGARIWFVSTHVPHAHVFYRELLRTVADVELVLGEKRQSLSLVTLEKKLDRLACPSD